MILQTYPWYIVLFILLYNSSYGKQLYLIDSSPNPTVLSCSLEIEVPDDITICEAQEISLDGSINGDYISFLWTQDGNFLSDSDLDPDVFIESNTTFTLTAYQLDDDNLIVNGDFSSDWVEYTDYFIGTTSCYGAGFLDCEGAYGILDNPNDGHTNFDPCPDHTGGGDMMVVNGAASYQQIWCQTINIDPDGLYLFTAWATSVNPSSPAQLQFAIDGVLIGNLFTLSSNTCDWEEFTAEWQAEGETSIEICVTNQNTTLSGNDFALDDISFQQICVDKDSFDVTFSDFDVLWNSPEEINCILLQTEIILDVEPIDDYTFEWETNNGHIVDLFDEGYVALVDAAGTYIVTVTDNVNCTEEIEIEVDAEQDNPELFLTKSNDFDCSNDQATIEVADNQGGLDFTWLDSDGEIISYDDEFDIYAPGTYIVYAVNPDTGCSNNDTISVIIDTIAPYFNLISSNFLDCNHDESLISTDIPLEDVIWTGPDSLIQSLGNNDSLLIATGGVYYAFTISENNCSHLDSIYIQELVPIFEYTIEFDSLINCNSPLSFIDLIIDSSIYNVEWENPVGGGNQDSIIIDEAGTYSFTITDSLFCITSDSIKINSDFNIPNPGIVNDTIDCIDSEAEIIVDDPENDYTVMWEDSANLIFEGDSLTTNQSGIYYYTIEGSNGCISSGEINVESSEDFPTLEINGLALSCNNLESALTVIADQTGLEYYWFGPNGNMVGENETITTMESGIYTVEGVNSLGCQSIAYFELLVDTIKPEFEIQSEFLLDCNTPIIEAELINTSDIIVLEWSGPSFYSNDSEVEIEEAGVYTVQGIAYNGCQKSESFTVDIDTTVIHANINTISTFDCNIDVIVPELIIEEDYYTISWTGPNFSSSEESVELIEPGIYTLDVIGFNGCMNSFQLELDSDYQEPEFNINSTLIDCKNQLSEISVEPLSNIDQIDFISSGTLIAQGTTISVPYTEELEVMVTGINGCQSIRPITLSIDTSRAEFALDADELGCDSNPVFIELLTSANDFEATVFDSNQILIGSIETPIFDIGNYEIHLKTANGCISTKKIEIVETNDFPILDYFKIEENLCSTRIELSDFSISGGEMPYHLWIDGIDQGSAFNSFDIDGVGSHELLIVDKKGCSTQETVNIEAFIPVEVELPTIIELKEGQFHDLELSINLELNEIQTIHWEPSTYLSCDNCLQPTFFAEESISYEVTVIDHNGCEAKAVIELLVEKTINVYIPNVISLNNNKEGNSRFTIFSEDGDIASVHSLYIFDRWGNRVFENFDFPVNTPELGWDGSFRNGLVEEGVYVYSTILNLTDGKMLKLSGDLTVLR